MKTFRLLFFLAVVTAISATFISCGGDDTTTPPANNPTITFSQPTAQSINVDHYQDIVFNFTCTQNGTTKKALSRLKITAKYNPGGIETLVDTPALASNTFSFTYLYTISPNAPENQIISLTFSIEDKDGLIGSKVYTLSVKDLSDIIEKDIKMGAQSNATIGSYFASDSAVVYKSGTAKQSSNQARIDFVYLFDDFGGSADCIAAPRDTLVAVNNPNLCGSFAWAKKNATTFKQIPPMTDSAYNKIRTAAEIKQLYNNGTGTAVGAITQLTDASGGTDPTIIVFKTVGATPQYGLMKVKAITQDAIGAKDDILLNVRVTKK
jgi:hypothetical protein